MKPLDVERSPQQEMPDAWLYSRETLKWMLEPSLSKQLPPIYQIFSAYCYLNFKWTDANDLVGGKQLFQLLMSIYRILSQDFLRLRLSEYKVFLDPLDPRFFQVVNELCSQQADTQILRSLLAEGDTFLDVGANHGSFSIVASRLVGTQGLVVAIEPQPRLAKVVENSLEANALCKFQIHQVAIGDTEGEIDLLIPQGTSGSAGIYSGHSGTHQYRTVRVPLKRGDDRLDWQNFPGKLVIKLDVEGSEYAFLSGARKMIAAKKPQLIIEIHPGTLKASGRTEESLKQLLLDLGYKRYTEMADLQESFPLEDLSAAPQRNIVVLAD